MVISHRYFFYPFIFCHLLLLFFFLSLFFLIITITVCCLHTQKTSFQFPPSILLPPSSKHLIPLLHTSQPLHKPIILLPFLYDTITTVTSKPFFAVQIFQQPFYLIFLLFTTINPILYHTVDIRPSSLLFLYSNPLKPIPYKPTARTLNRFSLCFLKEVLNPYTRPNLNHPLGCFLLFKPTHILCYNHKHTLEVTFCLKIEGRNHQSPLECMLLCGFSCILSV